METPCPLLTGSETKLRSTGELVPGLRNQASVNSNPGADIDFLLILRGTLFLSFHLRTKVKRAHQSPRRVFRLPSGCKQPGASFLKARGVFTRGVLRHKPTTALRQVLKTIFKEACARQTCLILLSAKFNVKGRSSLVVDTIKEQYIAQTKPIRKRMAIEAPDLELKKTHKITYTYFPKLNK